MRRFLLISIITILFPIVMDAQLSNRTRMFLRTHQTETKQTDAVPSKTRVKTKTLTTVSGTTETVQCFISLKDWSLSELENEGVVINSKFKNMVLATVPVNKLEVIAEKQCVKQIDVEKRVRLLTDVARTKTYAEDVQTLSNAAQAAGLTQAYDGTGVVLGIIDDGIEFNHTAFKDANGTTRVKAVYMPNASSANGGSRATIDGSTLPGYQYTTASQIGNLTTDDTKASHGTHTTGCAGGTRVTTTGLSNNTTYSGMAPGVDLILCGCGSNLTDAAISNSAKYIANYAKTHNQPCIISISLGATMGPHDGTSSLCQVYDEIAEEYGSVIFLAAGNEADMNCSLKKTLSSNSDYIATQIAPTSYFTSNYASYYGLYCVASSDIWNSTSDELQVQFIVYQGSTIKYTSNKMSNGSISSSTLSSYFTSVSGGGIEVTGGVDENNGRYNLYVDVYLGTARSSSKLAMIVYGKDGNVITMWNDASYSQYSSGTAGSYTLTAGNGTNSICDDVTGKKTISVGAWADRLSIPYNYGSSTGSMSNDSYSEQDIAYFSSYGTDFYGVQHPFVASPGHSVISSVNRYDTESITLNESAYRKSLGSNTYDYWMYMSGTSMATPCAAGIVALWLQADPTLNVDDVKTIITETVTHDSYTDGSNKIKFGAGKINALEGIKYILENATTEPTIKVNPSELSFTGYAGETYTETVTVTGLNLEADVTATLTGDESFAIDKNSITQSAAASGDDITITWNPTTQGEKNATLTLSSTGAEDVVVNIKGTVVVPELIADPETVSLTCEAGLTAAGSFSVLGADLKDGVTATLNDPDGVFSLSTTTVSKADAEEGKTIDVTFAPTVVGNYTATITLTTPDTDDIIITLNGTATTPVPTLTASEQALTFSTDINTPEQKTITLSGRALSGDITISLADNAGVFTVSPTTISASEIANNPTITVTFQAAEDNTYTGSLTISSEGVDDITISLSATASDGGTASDLYLNIAKYATIDEAGWNTRYVDNLYKYTEYEDNEVAWLTLSSFGSFSSIYYSPKAQKWIAYKGTGQDGNQTWTETNIFKGHAAYFTTATRRCMAVTTSNNKTEQTLSYYVTNCTAVKALGKNTKNVSESYPMTLKVYECTKNADGSLTEATTATKSELNGTARENVSLSVTDLDASKIYKVVVGIYRSYFYEIGFQTPLKKTLIGDVDRNGVVNMADVKAIVKIVLGKDTDEDNYDYEAAHVNSDDNITIADVTALINMLLQK